MAFTGKVIQGLQNGRTFGFPTANILLNDPEVNLESGVFAVKVCLNDEYYYGMLYVGTRPTLHLSKKSIEINIFDFSQNIYNQLIDFQILKKIRDEMVFDSVDQLILQINKDYEEVKTYLGNC